VPCRSGPQAPLFRGKISIYKKIRRLKLRPEGGERINMAIGWEIKESFPKRESVEKLFFLLGAFHKKMNNVRRLKCSREKKSLVK